jgi:3-oxoacyl-[acyl-carrier-protein] synthase-1
VSSIGNNCPEVLQSLRLGSSGIEFVPEWKSLGLKSQIAGTIKSPSLEEIRESFGPKGRFQGASALYAMKCAEEAISASGLSAEELSSEATGCIAGSGFSNSAPFQQAVEKLAGHRRRISPFEVTRSMTSTVSANIAYYYGLKGRTYSIGSACATSLHNLGHAYELVQHGICDTVLTGGAEEVSALITSMFDGMRRVMATSFNDNPYAASRPFDKRREGFVISGGAGMVVLEEYEKAVARGATIYAEVIGFGTCTDGFDIVQPDPQGTGGYRCMKNALDDAGVAPADIDYVNAHGTSTPVGDEAEAVGIRKMFGDHKVRISSTKSLTGHGIGASGIQEIIYCILMMQHSFAAGSANIDDLDSPFSDLNILPQNQHCELRTVLSNSFGFGGTNGSIVLRNGHA